jgi:2-(1,2-epoxy-1,2-dihydrophenyl)acetyl-CoA isomerase
MSVVLYEVADHVATVTLNRPERRNAMSAELLQELLASLERAAADDEVRAVVLTGAGPGFCVGGDLQAFAKADGGERSLEERIAGLRESVRCSELLRGMPKPTIAAVNGAAAGAGLSLACACDVRVAARSAVFRMAFLSAGLSGDFGGTWTLPRLLGEAKARELYLLNRKLDAAEAHDIGLVAEVVDDDAFAERVRTIATELAAQAPLAVASIKANLNGQATLSFAEHLDHECERHVTLSRSADSAEAARAFLEKRKPVFQGR